MVLSHQGKKEFSSPVEPTTAEALAPRLGTLHHAELHSQQPSSEQLAMTIGVVMTDSQYSVQSYLVEQLGTPTSQTDG